MNDAQRRIKGNLFNVEDAEHSDPVLSFTEEGSGPPLVLIHGLMMSGKMYLEVVPRFAEQHRVICPDLRGHAGSARLGPPYTIPQLARDVVDLLDRLGIHQFDLFGYSNGGIVAECIGATWVPRVRRLVLACAYAYNRATPREKVEAAIVPWVIRALGMQKFSRLMFSHTLEVGAESVTSLAEIMGSNDKDLMLEALHEGMFFDARPLLPNIKAPTLIIAGGKDDAVPMHHADQLLSHIDGARLEVLPEGKHTLIWTNPDDVVAITERFLEA